MDFIWDTIATLAEATWPEAESPSDKMTKHAALGSFWNSPPVKTAYWRFRSNLWARPELRPNLETLQLEIRRVAPFLESILAKPENDQSHELIHYYLDESEESKNDLETNWTLGDFIARFMLTAELWKQHPSCRSEAWDFGSPSKRCDVLGGILLGFWTLKQFDAYYVSSDLLVDGDDEMIWQWWMDAYPVLGGNNASEEGELVPRAGGASEETVLEEIGYLGGVGTRDDMPQRRVRRCPKAGPC